MATSIRRRPTYAGSCRHRIRATVMWPLGHVAVVDRRNTVHDLIHVLDKATR